MRTMSVDSRDLFREKMRENLRSAYGRETSMKRQGIVEPGMEAASSVRQAQGRWRK